MTGNYDVPPGLTLYKIYILVVLMLAYLLNQLDRYMLAIVAKPLAQELEYGEMDCTLNSSFPSSGLSDKFCAKANETLCRQLYSNGTEVCTWDYNGQGFGYQLLAGPIFIVVFTFAGIPVSIAADAYNRKVLLAISVTFWSTMTLLMGFVKEYWQLAILRFGLGIGEAGCTPFATSLIADYFGQSMRGTAISFYNWGIYMGYSLSYAVGNFVTKANILGQGWRWSFIISGIPGLLVGPMIMLTVMEPSRQQTTHNEESGFVEMTPWYRKLGSVIKAFCSPTLLTMCLAGSIRNSAGYVWAYNTQIYYQSINQSPQDIGIYMSWIPLVGGSIGVVLGGIISDKIVKRVGPHARLLVLVASQLISAPFVAGALFLHPPWAYISLIPGYVIGEMWIGISLTLVIELVPVNQRTTAVAVYLFIISNIAGAMPLLMPPIKSAFLNLGYDSTASLRAALYILYPGMYVLGALLYLLAIGILRRDLSRAKQRVEVTSETDPLLDDYDQN